MATTGRPLADTPSMQEICRPAATAPATAAPSNATIQIESGDCWVFFAFDVGHSINLDAAHAALARSRPTRGSLSDQRRRPAWLQFTPPPLQVVEDAAPIRVVDLETTPSVQYTFFDFGAVAVAYRIPLVDIDLAALARLAGELYECRTLLDAAKERVRAIVALLGDAIVLPATVDLVEDYVVFHAERWTAAGERSEVAEVSGVLESAPALAAILRAADEPLSDDEIADALASRVSYGRHDITIVDWNAAMVFDPRAKDILAVLEFGNVELLEMRFLDDRLDGILDRAYQPVSGEPRFRASREERRHLAALQMDSALLFEGINNAVKLVGDQFLARLYRLVGRRFHLAEWDESVMRKLETVQRLYEKFSDEQSARRMEVLEWIIILLIAVSIVIPFIPGLGH